jgi:hypothetical protein
MLLASAMTIELYFLSAILWPACTLQYAQASGLQVRFLSWVFQKHTVSMDLMFPVHTIQPVQ